MKVLVTGASGFVGSAVVRQLKRDGFYQVHRAVRNCILNDDTSDTFVVGDINGETDWSTALVGVDVVVHTAARVHMMQERAVDPLMAFRRVNLDGSVNLAMQAARAGVRRLIFISSVKVNGEVTELGKPFRPDDSIIKPTDPYGISKYEAELALREIGSRTGMEITIIRPVLVYGPGVRANFQNMMRWIDRRVPLPLGAVRNNLRSLVSLGNLSDLIVHCIWHPAAAGNVFFAADGEDVSTADLILKVGSALGRPPRLIAIPPLILQVGASLIGRTAVVQRLCGSLQVDISDNLRLLQWRPPISMDDALIETASAFRVSGLR